MEQETTKKSGLLTAGFVLGIIGVVLSFIPIINNIAFVLGLLAIIFALVAFSKKTGTTAIKVTTLILGIAAIAITLAIQAAFTKSVEDSLGSDSKNEDGSATIFADSKGLELDGEVSLDKSGYSTVVRGIMINNADVSYNNPNVKFSAFDANGSKLDDCAAYLSLTIEPGEKVSFEASCGDYSGAKVNSVQLKEFAHF